MPNIKNISKPDSKGFTLVELLLVITLISIMAGILLSTLNYKKNQKNADEAIRKQTMYKIIESLEAYRMVIGKYPPDVDNDSNPGIGESATDTANFNEFFKVGWPNDIPKGAAYLYDDPAPLNVGLIVATNRTNRVFKWRPAWGVIKECASTTNIQDDLCP